MAYIAGAFTATYNGTAIGETETGFTIEWFLHKQLITGDNAGRSPQDAVNLGAECFVEFTLLNWPVTANPLLTIWPVDSTVGDHGTIGNLDSNLIQALALTAVANTPAAGLTGEDLWTFPNAILAEGFPVRVLLSPELRTVPIRMRVYPNSSGVYFTRA